MYKRLLNLSIGAHYKKHDSVLNKSEEAFFLTAQNQLPNGFYIFPKMRIADIIDETDGKGYYFLRNKILPKHIDFLICDHLFHPIVCIELNGMSHEGGKRKQSDRLKKEVFQQVNLPLEFIEVGSEFSVDIKNLIDKYLILK